MRHCIAAASVLAFLVVLVFLSGPTVVLAADAPHDAVKPVPRNDAWWQNRHKSFNERIAKGNVDVLMIGDSITHGWEGKGKEVWAEYYAKRNAVNLGIGGDRTQHVLWRLENGNIEGISPKLAVLMIGTNNSNDNTPVEIAEGIAMIVKKLRTELPEMKVLVLAIFPRGANADDPRRKVNEQANEIVAMMLRVAGDPKIEYLDIADAFLTDDGVLPKEIMPDLLHPHEKGYGIWAEAVEPTIQRMLGE